MQIREMFVPLFGNAWHETWVLTGALPMILDSHLSTTGCGKLVLTNGDFCGPVALPY
jgi:hypothetical protein